MTSSYEKNNFNDIVKSITFITQPKKIVEFGILNGYSLNCFIQNSNNNCQIYAYDIFEKFEGNSANYDEIMKIYKDNDNVHIKRCDFYTEHENIKDNSIDILHIDIANDGDTYLHCISKYYQKVIEGGVIILEGGSKERDNVEWMKKYNKKPIQQVLETLSPEYQFTVFDQFPSITVIRKQTFKVEELLLDDWEKYIKLRSQLGDYIYNLTRDEFIKKYDSIKNQNGYIYVIKINNELVATAKLLVEIKFGQNVGHIEDVICDSNHTRKGYGSIVLKHCLDVAKTHNCYKTVLQSDIKNSQFYKKNSLIKSGVNFTTQL